MKFPKRRKRFIKKRTVLLIVLCITLGFYVAYKVYKAPSKRVVPWVVVDAEDSNKKFISKETFISQIQQKQRLITTEVELKEKIVLDNSWGSMDLFKKVQNINFTGKGLYTVDLSQLKPANITLNPEKKHVAIKITKPAVEMVSIIEDKTVYETPQNGLLRFGEIKLTSAEQQLMTKTVKDKMSEKMLEKQYFDQATSNTEKALTQLVHSILKDQSSSFKIDIEFQ